MDFVTVWYSIQCFHAVGWVAGRASSLYKQSGRMLAWLSAWSEVQICIWPSWCHCHSLLLNDGNRTWHGEFSGGVSVCCVCCDAVVNHIGARAIGGHYIVDVFHPGYNCWVRCDDNLVSSVPTANVTKFTSPKVPYLIFYRRLEPS